MAKQRIGIFSVSPKPGQAKVAVKDKNGRLIYHTVSRSEIAVEGKVRFIALRDQFFGGPDSREFRSPVLTNPTWGRVFTQFERAMRTTRDMHHAFLEGVYPVTADVDGKRVPVVENGVALYRFSAGS